MQQRRRPPQRRPQPSATNRSLVTINRSVQDLASVTREQFTPQRRDINPTIFPSRQNVYRFKRTFTWPTNVTASSAGEFGALAFTLDSVPSYTDFTALFDKYRIVQAILQFSPLTSQFGPSTSASQYPTVYTVIDIDDNTTPSTVVELQQYDTLMVTPTSKPFQRVLTPHAALAAYSGAFTSYANAPSRMYFDCNSPSIIYYGLKWGTSPITVVSGTYQLYSIDVTLILEFTHVR